MAQSPQAAFSQIQQNDPRLEEVMKYIRENGGDAKTLFFSLAKQKGKDPNVIINQVQSIMRTK